ncbi:MAG: 4-hydroxythreonine-4-phosphate dehydrogenase PdxA, partial [Bacteroidaceae bacterium]|nr:4-hydroxythreonine-4-phosphate dehydrogenase PdxA [Bacteroidaceae bacterium]
LKTFEAEEMLDLCTPVIYGSPKAATYHRKAVNNQTNFTVRNSIDEVQDKSVNMINCFGEEEIKIEYGTTSPAAESAAITALDWALQDLKAGKIDVLVTAPFSLTTPTADGCVTQTEYIQKKLEEEKTPLNIMMAGTLRIALVTENLPISKVASAITKDTIIEKMVTLQNTLKRDFYIDNPRIAVLALNPKDGENEFAGTEEKEIIMPAMEELFNHGVRCFGPYPADYIFGNDNYKRFDAILAMYHDQGYSPFKTLEKDNGVNYTAGLSIVATSPAQGNGYDIAGKGEASESPFRNAIYAAIDALRNRRRYDSSHAHPLRRQYYEKRDDSDKLKLDQATEDTTL